MDTTPHSGAPGPAATAAWGLLAGGLALGLVGGVVLAAVMRERKLPAPVGRTPPIIGGLSSPNTTTVTLKDIAGLVERIEQLERSLTKVVDAIEDLVRVQRDQMEAGAAAHATTTPPGRQLVPGMPPEGVPLVKAWYARRIEGELAEIESALETPVAHLGSRASPEAVAAQKGRWKARVKQLLDDVESLRAIETEAQLARWLDTTERGKGFPKLWQLAELAAELRRKG